jgi:hypothetical protein
MSPEITAEDYRTAVKVMRAHRQCDWSPGDWERRAAELDAEADRKADVDSLAEHMCNAAFDYDTAWAEAVEPERKRFRQYAEAALAKLDADGRLRPPVVDAEVADEPETWATWQEVPAGVMYRAQSGVGNWVNDLGIRLATIDWKASTYTDADMRHFAPFVRVEA